VLSVALNMWGLIELEKLAYAASAPFVAGLVDTGGRAAERFGVVAERWRVDENEKQKIEEVVNEVLNAPQKRERPFSKLTSLKNLPKPLVELRKALKDAVDKAKIDEVEKDTAVVATLVLYKTLVKNAWVYGEWAELYKWARGLVGRGEFTVAAGDIERLRGAQRRLGEAAEEVRRELNRLLVLYSQSDFYKERPDLLNKLKQHLEVDVKKAEGLAEASRKRFSNYSDVNMGTKAYAALLSIAKGGMYGHAAMLLMIEGALADIILSTPGGAYNKADRIAKGRGEAVDPSRVGAAGWEDMAASALLRYLLSRAVGEDLVFRWVEGGFEVFRVYGGVETRIDELKIEKTARSKASEEVLRRLVEEARRTVPDLSGIKKIRQTLEWLATDMSFARGRIEASTAQPWQAAWYIALFGEPKSIRGRANITEEGVKPNVTMYWPREVLDRIIAEEGEELKPLLGPISKQGGGSRESEVPAVKSWRGLVDAIDWSWVLKRVEEMVGELKPWIGPEKMDDAEREGLVRRMLGELALLVHFAEARRGLDDSKRREERARRLAEAVEALSGGRIAGEYADRLARLIIRYAERREERAKKRIENLAEEVGISRGEVWGVVDFVLSDMYCLAKDCADDKIIRKFVAPALELIILDKALKGGFSKEKALLYFGEMYATAIAGDGTVGPGEVVLTVGGELGGGAALLRLATLHLLNQLLPDEPKFGVRTYVEWDRYYYIAAHGENATKLKRPLAATAPSSGGEYLSPKFDQFVEEVRVEVRPDNIRLTPRGLVAADLIISDAGIVVKYNVYLRNAIELDFRSTDWGRVELAARLLKVAGVDAEVKKEGNRDVWYVRATTDMLAAGREELRRALAEIVKTAIKNGWVDAGKAEGWLEELAEGRVLKEGWPEYGIWLTRSGALVVRYHSTDRNSIEREKQRLENMGLEEGKHFSVKMPEGGKAGYVRILKEGLERAAWLSIRGEGEQQRRLAAEFVSYILQRAEKEGGAVYEKAKEIVEEGKERSSLTLKGFEKEVEVGGRRHVVKVIGGEAVEEGRGGRKLLRIKITAEVDGVRRDYMITYGRYGTNAAVGFATARADPDGREEDAKRLAAVIKALTGKEPKIRRMNDGRIMIVCGRSHLDGFKRYAELADVIERWLEETGR